MAFHQEISVPVRGQYYLRTAIHDMISDRVGAVEVPIAEVHISIRCKLRGRL